MTRASARTTRALLVGAALAGTACSTPAAGPGAGSPSPAPIAAAPAAPTPPEPPAPTPPHRAERFVDDPALTLEVRARIKTGVLPKSVHVSPDGRQLWVCNFGYSGRRNVYVYDTATLARIGVVEFEGNAVEVGFAHAGGHAYVSNFARGTLEIVDTRSFEVVDEVRRVGQYPKVVAVAPDDARVYVANWGTGDVAVVDPAAGRVVAKLDVGRRPRGMAVDADGTVYVNAMWDHRVQVFDPRAPDTPEATRPASPRSTIDTCQFPRHAVLDGSGPEPALFVTCSGDDRLRWHGLDGRVLGEVEVGDNPRSFGLSDDGQWSAVANFDASSVTLVDLAGGRLHTTEIPDTDRIVGLAVAHGPALRVFATSWGDNQLIELGL